MKLKSVSTLVQNCSYTVAKEAYYWCTKTSYTVRIESALAKIMKKFTGNVSIIEAINVEVALKQSASIYSLPMMYIIIPMMDHALRKLVKTICLFLKG